MVDRNTRIRAKQIFDGDIKQEDLDLTNTPIDGQIIKINMPTGDFTAIDAPSTSENLSLIRKNQDNIALNAFRIAINGSLTQFNMIDGIVDEYEDESGIDTGASTNQSYDSVNDLYSPNKPTLDTSPFAHFKLNDNAGNTTVTDDGTGANNGTAQQNTSNMSTTGKINEALDFNGSTDYINVDTLYSGISSDTKGSFSVWVNPDVLSTTHYDIFAIGDTDTDTLFRFVVDSAGIVTAVLVINGTVQWSADTPSSTITTGGGWYHIVVVQDGTEVKIYVNNVSQSLTFGVSLDKTKWISDLTGIDNVRIGCQNNHSTGNTNFWDGQLDDFRYYSGIALTQAQVDILYNSGNGTEADQPSSPTADNMTLISTNFTAEAQPDSARIVLFEEDVDAITLNTDLKAYASRDGGTTYSQIILVNEGEYEPSKNILSASVDISGQPAGTDMKYKIETLNNKDLKLHGTSLSWD